MNALRKVATVSLPSILGILLLWHLFFSLKLRQKILLLFVLLIVPTQQFKMQSMVPK